MSYLFDLNPTEQRGAFQTAVTNSTDIVNAPFFEGAGTGLMSGIKTAVERRVYSDVFDEERKQEAIDTISKLRPDPRSVGMAGQILYGVADPLASVAGMIGENPLTIFAPTLLAAQMTDLYAKTQEQVYLKQGLDPVAARNVATTEGITFGAGVILPAGVPGKLLTRVLSGGAINTAVGGVSRAAMSYELENAGYVDMARQYKPFDAAGIVIDFTVGALFGATLGPRTSARDANVRVLPSDVDAALTMGNAAHIETGTIPGMPTDSVARQAHVNAVNKALDDLMNGRPVDVGDQVTRAPFEPRGESVLRQEVTLEVEQHLAEQLQNLKAELERRGLSTEDIDQTAPVTLREAAQVKDTAGVEIAFNDRGDYLTATSAAGRVGGIVKDGTLRINFAEVEQAMRGKGEGVKLYTALIDQALNSGLKVTSDFTVEPAAVRVYEALKRRGYDVVELNPKGRLEDGTRFGKDAAAPAFEVRKVAKNKKTSVKIEGKYQDATWAIVDAKDVEATMAKGPNQFRDRFRAASQTQIEKIANAPDFNLLEESPLMDFGAPTLTRDGLIVGGNGRFAGVSKSYGRGTGEIYRTALRASLDKFGLKEADLAGKERPVLVRVLDNPVDVQRVAIASNEGAGLRMSALEQAKVDSVRLGDITGMSVGDNGEVNLAANISYIQRWAAQFPETEQAALVDKAGRLSQEGEKRLRNAILFRAYGDSPTLERLVESTDPGARNVATALVRTAPMVAEMKAAMERGDLYPLDISEDVTAAVEKLDAIRSSGDKVKDYLAQNEMFGSELTPIARMMLEQFDKNMRSAKAMTEIIKGYYDAVEALGNPRQGNMLAEAPPTREQILASIVGEAQKAQQLPLKNADQARINELLSTEGVFDEAQLARLPEAEQGALRNLYQRAAQLKDAFDQLGQEIAQQVGGRLLIPNIKGTERAVAKITSDLGGNASQIKDLLRATIEVDSVAQARAAIDLLQQRFQVLESGYRDLFDPAANPKDGYRDAKMNVQLDGIVAEIQVNLPAMLEAKKQVHSKYVERSAIERAIVGRDATDAELARIERLNAEMKDVYDAAFASATKDANLASETGAPFLRADSELNGRGGSVSQAAQYNLTPGTLPRETGMPSTSKSSTEGGNFTDITSVDNVPEKLKNVNAEAAVAAEVLTERPDLTIPDENGQPMLASDALAQADAEIASAMREAPGFDAAVSCALRNS